MAYAYNKNGNPFLDQFDLKRASRAFPKLLADLLAKHPDPSKFHPNDVQDFLARLAGLNSSYELFKLAKSNDLAKAGREPILILQEEALQEGEPFPHALPAKFDNAWREQAVALFTKAMDCKEPGQKEMIVLVGNTGSGKTLLAKHMAHLLGGVVLDATLNSQGIPRTLAANCAVQVYDRPAVIPQPPKGRTGTFEDWKDMNYMRQYVRSTFRPGGMMGLYMRLLDNAKTHPETHLVTSLPNEAEVAEFLTSVINPGTGYIWRAAHVVNLDTMTFHTIRPPERVTH